MNIRSLELKVPPPVVAFICAVVLWIQHLYLPLGIFDFRGRVFFAFSLVVIASILFLNAGIGFRRKKTTVDPIHFHKTTSLVTTGVYSFTRNPMYLASFLVLAGWACYLGHIGSFFVLAFFVAYITFFQIMPEECFLLGRFGTEYENYLKRVRRWI